MLLAEIHGKRNEAVQSDEDYLTSTIFGQLRYVKNREFWERFFTKAISVVQTSLAEELRKEAFQLSSSCAFAASFWPSYTNYGEPDLLFHFQGETGRSLLLIIEVKLFSGKSGHGANDQLRRYYDLLHDREALGSIIDDGPVVALIYLTERYALDELSESVSLSSQPLAASRMFTLQWQDLLDVALSTPSEFELLREVALFLMKRGLQAFSGFHSQFSLDLRTVGRFYESRYFEAGSHWPELNTSEDGGFYVS